MRKAFLLLSLISICSILHAQAGYAFLQRVNVHRNIHLDPFFKGVSASVSPITLLTPASLLAYSYLKDDAKVREKAWICAGGIVVNSGISLVLKLAVKRERPYAAHPDIQAVVQTGPYSFPSAHSSNAFMTATCLTLLFPKWYVAVPAYAWAGLSAYSRMHLGVHYPGDVIGGALIGTGSAVLCYYGNRWLRKQMHRS
ncbi:MAG: phosphatase PAP2 family protein [Bacteroidetes bacterium]|nr:phosphatase PAP2 family protein [Bacteroidota bacterium]